MLFDASNDASVIIRYSGGFSSVGAFFANERIIGGVTGLHELSGLSPSFLACLKSLDELPQIEAIQNDCEFLAHGDGHNDLARFETGNKLYLLGYAKQAIRMFKRKRWTRDELLIALNLYHKLTFGQLHARQPVIVALAEKLGRGANSVAMKLCNFASLDPVLKLRGIKGLAGASALDRAVWDEFHADLNEAVPASEGALRTLFGADEGSELEVLPKQGVRVRKRPLHGPTETTANVKLRRGQEYFRDAVLNNFGGRCGVTDLTVRQLLIASHILPWGTHVAERLNVRNGICLSRLHDAAFDRGLITFDDKFRLLLSPRLKAELPQRSVAENFGAYAGETLHFPDDAAPPELAFLSLHRANIFRKK